ncbi:hypothetical protein EPR50_G00093460 [Perca flavescens]|uniref:Uncharacterized protein n=1 Tax=Perca flavescens TaxID=8167 RepID=A0A484CYK5_PERFV|nr:hypothetical protein EPR50_G00093460 [Perca flavescens]
MDSTETGSPAPPRTLEPQVLVYEDTPCSTLQEMNSSESEEDDQKAVKRPLKMSLRPRRLYRYHGAGNPQLTPSPHGSQPMTKQPMTTQPMTTQPMTTQPTTTQPQPPPPLEDSPPPPSGGDLSKVEDTEKTDPPDELDSSSESKEGLTAEDAEQLLQTSLKKPRGRRRVLPYTADLKEDIKRVFRDVWSDVITVGMMNDVLNKEPALLEKCQKLKLTIHNFRALVHKLQKE